MAGEHGGYRQPSNPAPVSPPGALSQRTDGGAIEGINQSPMRTPGTAYGQGGNMAQQKGAPLAGNPYTPAPMVSLNEPPTDLSLPMSHGLNMGAGAGSEAMPPAVILPPQQTPSNVLRKVVMNDPSGVSGTILKMLLDRGL